MHTGKSVLTKGPMDLDKDAFTETLKRARARLLEARCAHGHWEGRLSSSALSTATALCALFLKDRERYGEKVKSGLKWLREHINRDGGWGDTWDSPSNMSTTTLGWAAFAAAGEEEPRAGEWLRKRVGSLEPQALAKAISDSYGKDRTFSVPILTMCALSGRLGTGREIWRLVKPLPFELAAVPHRWLKRMRLTVVSYALPALIAIGQARHSILPTSNPFTRLLRNLTRKRTLDLLERIQPESGGFLEAVPLTSFVTMSLVAVGEKSHPVAEQGAAFLEASMREDGSWPIDTNLATWVTTLSVNSLDAEEDLHEEERERIASWLLKQQYKEVHPYTNAAPGGWAWTDLPGGVPDADDTAGALLALHRLGVGDVKKASRAGIQWLLSLQNSDGGIPTFCRGWGKLPFDRSAPDLTAHALAAMSVQEDPPREAIQKGLAYLKKVQSPDGAWVPLWFGNQEAPLQENPVYGTARVLSGLSGLLQHEDETVKKGLAWLKGVQNQDQGWGGDRAISSTVEETALAVGALARWEEKEAALKGTSWLLEKTGEGKRFESAPIGLYFARLWYHETLYPVIYTVLALQQVKRLIS